MVAKATTEKCADSQARATLSPSAFSIKQSNSLLNWLINATSFKQIVVPSYPRPTLHASQFTHGQSNPTYLVILSTSRTKFPFVLRSQPAGKLLPGAHRLDREYKVLTALQNTSIPVPKPYAYCSTRSVLGAEFYVMQYVEGTIFKDASLRDLRHPADRSQVYREAVRILLNLRCLDIHALGIASLSRPSPSWVHRQVDTWYRQYQASRMPGFDYNAMEALHKRLISERGKLESSLREGEAGGHDALRTLVHGDFRIDNLVYRRNADGRLVCVSVLDWELASLGNPLADFASLLTAFHMPRHTTDIDVLRSIVIVHPRPPGIPQETELVEQYCRNLGDLNEIRLQISLYLAVSLFKFAAVIYGVQCRARHGNAASSRGALLGEQAHYFAEAGNNVLDIRDNRLASRIDGKDVIDGLVDDGLLSKVCRFMEKEIMPLEKSFFEHTESASRWNPWQPMEILKSKAKAAVLWNLFLPKSLGGALLSAEYSPLAEVMGRCVYAAEVFNCSAPDTGNMELLARFGTTKQKEQWLKPLLNGEIRSCFGMTEPEVASSDVLNLGTRIDKHSENYIVNGRKWWTSGAMDSRCKLMILIGRGPVSSEDSPQRHRQHTIVLIPMATAGVDVARHLKVFGFDDAPHGHAEVILKNVTVKADEALLYKEGGGFEAAQSRLGGGRLHHCMRLVGVAERAHELMVERSDDRVVLGKKLLDNDAITQQIGQNRSDIETMRALTRAAASAIDMENRDLARKMVGAAKIYVPRTACTIIDKAIQAHGGLGVCQDSLLSLMYIQARSLRIADGPDESHLQNLAKQDIKTFRKRARL